MPLNRMVEVLPKEMGENDGYIFSVITMDLTSMNNVFPYKDMS